MTLVIAIVVSLIVGTGAGYGFRGLLDREGKKLEAEVITDLKAELAKLKADAQAEVKKL